MATLLAMWKNITFSSNSARLKIDLKAEHAENLRKALALYVSNARKISASQPGDTRRTGSSTAPASRNYDPKAVRAWATEQGIEVPARGRVPLTMIESYRWTHGGS